jgi:hypothetical protein
MGNSVAMTVEQPEGHDTGAPAATAGQPAAEPSGEAAVAGEPAGPGYGVALALQRGPYPYEQRISVVAARDEVGAEDEDTPTDGWAKAVTRAYREGGEVQIVRLTLPEDRVQASFMGVGGPRSFPLDDHYNVRLALCRYGDGEDPPAVVGALDEQTAQSVGVSLTAPLGKMPMPYRRRVARARGEIREVIVSVSLNQIEQAFDPPPAPAVLCEVLTARDPRG